MNAMPSLSRTSSTTSIDSSDDAGGSTASASHSRRTRKRFSNVQLTMLEQLFHQNSHPSREEREKVAQLGGMFVHSIEILSSFHRASRKADLHGLAPIGRRNP
jgi:hypothetical protein